MGKRSNFERVERDFYPTPYEAVVPLFPHLNDVTWFAEPCAGDGALVNHLEEMRGISCGFASDIEPQADYIKEGSYEKLCIQHVEHCTHIITNPPWDRKILHPMIEHFCALKPTWLLFDADWMHTKQSARFMPWLVKIVSVGRVKWIPDSKMIGKDNCCWYFFDSRHKGVTEFVGRA